MLNKHSVITEVQRSVQTFMKYMTIFHYWLFRKWCIFLFKNSWRIRNF